jgi:hypothetical protein
MACALRGSPALVGKGGGLRARRPFYFFFRAGNFLNALPLGHDVHGSTMAALSGIACPLNRKLSAANGLNMR